MTMSDQKPSPGWSVWGGNLMYYPSDGSPAYAFEFYDALCESLGDEEGTRAYKDILYAIQYQKAVRV